MLKKNSEISTSLPVVFFSSIVISFISIMFWGSVISTIHSTGLMIILSSILCLFNVYLFYSGYRSAKAQGSLWWKRIFIFTILVIIIYIIFMNWFLDGFLDSSFAPIDEYTNE